MRRKKDHTLIWGHGKELIKLTQALNMIEHTSLPEVSLFTGVPENIIIEFAYDLGKEAFLFGEKTPLSPVKFYDDLIPKSEETTREERLEIIRTVAEETKNKCDHSKFYCRCARCTQILGSEQHFKRIETVEETIKRTLDERYTLDLDYNENIEDFARSLLYNLYEEITNKH